MIALAPIAVGAVIKLIADRVVLFFAVKALLTTLFIVAVPIILNNLAHDFMNEAMLYMNSKTTGLDAFSGAMQAVGLMAWLCECFRIPECISILVSALQLHLVLKMIPFSPIK
mgnify:CR=1 FL=1